MKSRLDGNCAAAKLGYACRTRGLGDADPVQWPASSIAPPRDAAAQGITLQVFKLAHAQGPKHGFVLLPKRWIVERSFAWAARFRRLARDYERLPDTVAGLTFLAFTCLMLHQLIHLPCGS